MKQQHIKVEDSELINVETPAVLPPIDPNESGFGYPYAPQNWPNPGDNWRWKVGSRISKGDHHLDRYLYAPKHLPQPRAFASKTSLKQYIRKEFPDTDVHAFFAMFSWNIPATKPMTSISDPMASSSSNSSRDMKDDSESGSQTTKCPAGKKSCKGLLLEAEKPTIPCDICCTQSDFCRHCSCILCSKTVKPAFGGYSYFRCEAVVNEAYICGHVAHLNCALRCNMAGMLRGVFKLDAAYYCRRCDARSDLVLHAAKLLNICKSIDSGSDLEKILKVGVCILRGSEREPAQVLLRSIETAFYKVRTFPFIMWMCESGYSLRLLSQLKNGRPLSSIWEAEENLSTMPLNGLSNASKVKAQTTNTDSLVLGTTEQSNMVANSPDEQEINPLILEDEIFDTLQSLKKSQEAEYLQVEEKLYAQKTFLINLQEQLHHEKSQLAGLPLSVEPNPMLDIVKSRTEQIRRELKKLKEMQEVYKTFRKVGPLNSYCRHTEQV